MDMFGLSREPRITFDNVEVPIDTLPARSVSIEQYESARANTPGWQVLYSKLDDNAFFHAVENCLQNCQQPKDAPVYESTLVHYLVPELLRRWKGEV